MNIDVLMKNMGRGTQMTDQDYLFFVKEFEKNQIYIELEKVKQAEADRANFLKRFPIDKIDSMSMEDYLFAKKGYDNGDTFCDWLYSKLKSVASSGNARPDIYGIYYQNGNEITLSRTFKNFGNDYKAAFLNIKTEIKNLLMGVSKDEYEAVKKSRLNSLFKYKLLAVYFPDKFLPICTWNFMKQACENMDIFVNEKPEQEMVYYNLRLVEIKESFEITKKWHNQLFLGFCEWVGKSNSEIRQTKKQQELQKKRIEAVREIEKSIDGLNVVGEEREALIKVRVNQSIFRRELLNKYKSCALCSVDDEELLVASHIKPWAKSQPDERLDIDNGFIFCPNHDKLFDKGLITFNDDGELLISERVSGVNRIFTNIRTDMKVKLTGGQKHYLSYHREKIFKDEY